MPWYPNCGAEYGLGFEICGNCDLLLDEQPEQTGSQATDRLEETGYPEGIAFSPGVEALDVENGDVDNRRGSAAAGTTSGNPARKPSPGEDASGNGRPAGPSTGIKLLIALLLVPIFYYLGRTLYDILSNLFRGLY